VKSLTIGLVLDDSLDRPDGVQQMVILLGKWLESRGHRVHYIASTTKRRDLQHVHSVARSWNVSFNGNKLAIPRPSPKSDLVELTQKYKFDLLHVQMPYSPLMSGRLIATADVPVVGTFHILPYNIWSQLGTRGLGLVQARSLDRFQIVTATSEPARAFAASAYRVEPQIVPNPVELARFRAPKTRKSGDQFRIVFLGRLVARKGVMQLLRAVNSMSAELKSQVLVEIGGTGPDRARAETYVIDNQLQGTVKFRGFIKESDKPAFLQRADIAVFPSTGGESFGIVLVEAMAAGAGVVIGGDNPGYRSVLGEWRECLVDPNDTDAFAHRLAMLVHDEKLRNRLHRAQSKAVKQYDISIVGAQFEKLYRQAILDYQPEVA
jgi:phosphatidylinositol alpha-mannosyltransferase